MKNIHVKYFYSACVLIKTDDLSILCDPWFTEGIYDGSWYQYPKISNPIESIGEVDYIYISHIHPDHYDPEFLKNYFNIYGKKTLLIGDYRLNHLKNKIISDGFDYEILTSKFIKGLTTVEIFPHDTNSLSDIDSAMLVSVADDCKVYKVLNCNDIVFNDSFLYTLKEKVGDIDILLIGYTGAGPYPQCFFDLTDPQLKIEADEKKRNFIGRYLKNISVINARINIPFAGKYYLGGKLALLNDYRGISDPVEILEHDERAIVLADNGGSIDAKSLMPTAVRTKKYSNSEIQDYCSSLIDNKMNYEVLINNDCKVKLPFEYLMRKSFSNAIKKSELDSDYYICIQLEDKLHIFNCNKNKNEYKIMARGDGLPEPRSEYFLDSRHLFGLLTKIFHWNNAEVGSHLKVRRFPNIYNKKAIKFMNYFSI